MFRLEERPQAMALTKYRREYSPGRYYVYTYFDGGHIGVEPVENDKATGRAYFTDLSRKTCAAYYDEAAADFVKYIYNNYEN